MKGTKHDFSKAAIKHEIEDRFYRIAGKYLRPTKGHQPSGSIVTGPDALRHVLNFRKYLGTSMVKVCEIANAKTIASIWNEVGNRDDVRIVIGGIEDNVGRFTDADLTCKSDVEAIKLTLKRQSEKIKERKSFILSYSSRSKTAAIEDDCMISILNSVLESIDAEIKSSSKLPIVINGTNSWAHEEVLSFSKKGRIEYMQCITYNAGGGPMVTCLICYK